MTANAMQGDREKCLEIGMDDFIAKPVNLEQLEAVLLRWLPQDTLKNEEELIAVDTSQSKAQLPPKDSETADAPPPLDPEILDNLRALGGEDDLEFLNSVIDQFLEDLPRLLDGIRQAIDHHDAEELMKAAHGFKGSCRNIGAHPLADVCFALEKFGREGSTEATPELLSRLNMEEARVQLALRDIRHNLRV